MWNFKRMPQRRRRNCRVQTDFRQPREDNFHYSVSQCSLHQESLCKVSDYEISPHSKYNLPEICCCDSRGRAIYWLYKHNLADGECVRQTKYNQSPTKMHSVPKIPSMSEGHPDKPQKINRHQFRKQLLRLRDMLTREPSSDIRITETHNSYINLGDVEAFHILLSEENLCRDKYHNLVMNLEVKQKLLEEAHQKILERSSELPKDSLSKHIDTNVINSDDLERLFSIGSVHESNIFATSGLEINSLDHILNQLNFFIKSKRIDTISEMQREQLAKYLKILTDEYEASYRKREQLKNELTTRIDQKLSRSTQSVLELTKMPFLESASEIEIEPFSDTKKKSPSDITITDKKCCVQNINSSRIGSMRSILDEEIFKNLDAAKKWNSTELKNRSEKELTRKMKEKSRSSKKTKSEKKKSGEEERKKSEDDQEFDRLKKTLKEMDRELQKIEAIDFEGDRIKQLLRDQELDRQKAEEKEKEIQILKDLLKEKERKIAEEDVKEKQILKELLREKEKRKVEEQEERILLQEILKERERKKAEDEEREKQRLKELIMEKERIILEEKLKNKERKKMMKQINKEKKKGKIVSQNEELPEKDMDRKEKAVKAIPTKEVRQKEAKPKRSRSTEKIRKNKESAKGNHKDVKTNQKSSSKEKNNTKDTTHKENSKKYKEQPMVYYTDTQCSNIYKRSMEDNFKEMADENSNANMRKSLKELVDDCHKDKEVSREKLKKKDKYKDKIRKKPQNLDNGNVCDGTLSQIHLTNKDILETAIEKNEIENTERCPRFATCLADPPPCSSTGLFKEHIESLEKIPEEETVKDSFGDDKKCRKQGLKIGESVVSFSSTSVLSEKKPKKKSNVNIKGNITREVSANVEVAEIGISVKLPEPQLACFPTDQEDLFHLSKAELDVKNIKQDPRFRSPKKENSVEFIEKGVQMPSTADKGSAEEPSKTTLSKCSLPCEHNSEERLHLAKLFNTVLDDENDSSLEAEFGKQMDLRSLPSTTSCCSNHAVSIKDSLLHLDDEKFLRSVSPNLSVDDLSVLPKIKEREETDILGGANSIPIYKEGYEIARITNQTSSCFSTIRRYAKARVNKSTQMFEHVTSNDLYTLKWIHDNLFEIDINPHTLIVDEKILELSEMSGVS